MADEKEQMDEGASKTAVYINLVNVYIQAVELGLGKAIEHASIALELPSRPKGQANGPSPW